VPLYVIVAIIIAITTLVKVRFIFKSK